MSDTPYIQIWGLGDDPLGVLERSLMEAREAMPSTVTIAGWLPGEPGLQWQFITRLPEGSLPPAPEGQVPVFMTPHMYVWTTEEADPEKIADAVRLTAQRHRDQLRETHSVDLGAPCVSCGEPLADLRRCGECDRKQPDPT